MNPEQPEQIAGDFRFVNESSELRGGSATNVESGPGFGDSGRSCNAFTRAVPGIRMLDNAYCRHDDSLSSASGDARFESSPIIFLNMAL